MLPFGDSMIPKHKAIEERIRGAALAAVDLHRPYIKAYYLFSDAHDIHAMVAFRLSGYLKTTTVHIWVEPDEFDFPHEQLVNILFTRIQERARLSGLLDRTEDKCISALQTLEKKLKS